MKLRSALACICLALAGRAMAAGNGTTTADFLNLGVGARAIGIGGAYSAVADDATAMYWNPAALTRVSENSAAFMYSPYLADTALDYGAYAHNFGSGGALGVSVDYFSDGSIPITQNFQNQGTANPYNLAASVGYAYLLDGFSAGIDAKFIRSEIVTSADGEAFDAGILSPAYLGDRLRLALTAANIGSSIKFDQVSEPLPLAFRLGSAFQITENWLVSCDVGLPARADPYVAVGTEYKIAGNDVVTLAGRAGYSSYTLDSISGFSGASFGFGIAYGGMDLDYAFVPYGGLGQAHRVSLSFKWGAGTKAKQARSPAPVARAKAKPAAPIKASTAAAAAAAPAIAQAETEAVIDVDVPNYHSKPRPDDFAVVVGVGYYAQSFARAQFAQRDAEAVQRHLLAMGIPSSHIRFLEGPHATGRALKAAVEKWLPDNVKRDSTVYFYFSGLGAPDPQTRSAYLVPFDGDLSRLKRTAYSIDRLYSGFFDLPVHRVVVVLDSCFSGAGGRSAVASGQHPPVANVREGLLPRNGKILVLTAAEKNQTCGVVKDWGHGTLTYFLLRGLDGEALNSAGKVTLESLYDYLEPKVSDAARLDNRDQNPRLLPEAAKDKTAKTVLR
jgi:hypothetical protein